MEIQRKVETKAEKEKELEKDGWVRQNTIDEPRLSELVEMYELIGFEVHLEPLTSEEMKRMKCFEGQFDRYKTIYTRQKNSVDNKGITD